MPFAGKKAAIVRMLCSYSSISLNINSCLVMIAFQPKLKAIIPLENMYLVGQIHCKCRLSEVPVVPSEHLKQRGLAALLAVIVVLVLAKIAARVDCEAVINREAEG